MKQRKRTRREIRRRRALIAEYIKSAIVVLTFWALVIVTLAAFG